jgi:uncharacterized protein
MRALVKALQDRDVKAVRNRLSAGDLPDTVDEQTGESVLAIAAELGNLAAVRTLLEGGADPNFLGATAWPLQSAAGRGHAEVVELLLDYDADVDAEDEDKCNALSGASAGGHLDVVNVLIEAGVSAKHKNRQGTRPIIIAAEKGHQAIVDVLAPHSTPKDRQRAALIAKLAAQGPPSEAVTNMLKAAERGDLAEVKKYLAEGGNVDAMDQSGGTALLLAAHRGQVEILKLLLANGADVNHLDQYGNYPLLYAAMILGSRPAYEYLHPLTDKKLRDDFIKRMKRAQKMAAERGYPAELPAYLTPDLQPEPKSVGRRNN